MSVFSGSGNSSLKEGYRYHTFVNLINTGLLKCWSNQPHVKNKDVSPPVHKNYVKGILNQESDKSIDSYLF